MPSKAKIRIPIQPYIAPTGDAVVAGQITFTNRKDGSAATTYSSDAGASPSTAVQATDTLGRVPRFMAAGRYQAAFAPPTPNPLGVGTITEEFDVPLSADNEMDTASDLGFSTRVLNDANPRCSVTAAGIHTWGTGSATGDTELSRYVAGQIKVKALTAVNASIVVDTTSASKQSRTDYMDQNSLIWWAGREVNGVYRILNPAIPTVSTYPVELLATGQINLLNYTKVWATPNTVFGNIGIEVGAPMDGTKPFPIRLNVGITGFTGGTHGGRGDAITTDAADVAGATFWTPISVSNTFADKGSLNVFAATITLNEYSGGGDVYAEAACFNGHITVNRRGALISCEHGVIVSDTVGGTKPNRGPARIAAWSVVLSDANPYSAYNDVLIFGAGSPYLRSAARAFNAWNSGSARGGTAVYIAGSHANVYSDTQEWERALAVNVGASNNVPGTDRMVIFGDGSIFIGDNLRAAPSTLTTATSTDGNIGIALVRSATQPQIELKRSGAGTAGAALSVMQSADTTGRVRLNYDGKIQWSFDGTTAAQLNLYAADASNLKTDNALIVGAGLTAQSTISISSTSNGFIQFAELTADPAAPSTNFGRLYMKDNGAGKTQLVARFPTGAVQVIATEP